MVPKSVSDLLSQQSPEILTAMLETARTEARDAKAEAERREAEVRLIEDALTKVRRRLSGGRLTRDQVLEVVSRADSPLTAAEVHAILEDEGITASLNSVREHLRRLVEKNGKLVRLDDGRFSALFVPTADDDIPF